jgi:hypothetical protein
VRDCTFVVDGLDECNPMKSEWKRSSDQDSPAAFINVLKKTISGTETRVLIVSRDEAEIRNALRLEPVGYNFLHLTEFKISPQHVQSDALLFSRKVVNDKLQAKDSAFRDDLSNRIVEKCQGMFLWIRVLETDLYANRWKNKKQIQKDVLEATPTALDEFYDRNWQKILEGPSERAFSIMRWTVFTARPPTILQLTTALLVEDDDDCTSISIDDLPDEINDDFINGGILEICGSLLEVHDAVKDGGTAPADDLGSKTLHPIHDSAKQYIIHHLPLPSHFKANQKLLSSNHIHRELLGRLCLRYLSFENVWEEKDSAAGDLTFALVRSFRDYAASELEDDSVGPLNQEECQEETVRLMNDFFKPGNRSWEAWRVWHDNQGREEPVQVTDARPLAFACAFGLRKTAMYLLDEFQADVNHRDSLGRSAITSVCNGSGDVSTRPPATKRC